MLHLLLLLFLIFCSDAAVITHLPGFDGPLPFHLETGYVGVDDVNGVEMFYYFIESEGNPREDPVLLWLSGGPGCSAFTGLAFQIGIEDGYKPSLNLKGYLIGNPFTGDKVDINSRVPYLHGVGIISDALYESATKNCEGQDHRSPTSTNCANILDVVQKFISEIDEFHILEPKCVVALARSKRRLAKEDYNELLVLPSFFRETYNELKVPRHAPDIWCSESVREWLRCNRDLPYVYDIPSSIKYHHSLTIKGYRALVYSGDHDAAVPFLGTQAWVRSLNFSVVDDWRSWRVGGQVAGYTITYANNLTFATVKGAGHAAVEYRPKECLAIIRRWISYQPL